ncbi:MAG: dUTP diphosphatase, partial [Christensenellaceae bacterium]
YIGGQYIKMNTLKIKKLSVTATLPTRATFGSAGYDLYADIDSPITINPNEVIKIPTGIAIEIESSDFAAFIYARSGLSSKNLIAPVNCVGVIDSDYRGEICVPLINHGNTPYTFHKNDRIAQLVLTKVFTPEIEQVEVLSDTSRGENGFGASGK